MSNALRLVAGCAALAAVLPAQLTILDGNMNVTTAALSVSSQIPRGFQLAADALATNHGFEHWWYYRVAGDTSESSLRNVGGVVEGVTVLNDHADRDFANVDARNLLRASIDFDVYDTGPASGVVISRLSITNTSNAPVTLDLFCFSDLDVGGSSGDVVTVNTSVPNTVSHFVTDISGMQVEVRCVGSDLSDARAYPLIRSELADGDVDNLTGAIAGFAGDYTGAFQWQNRTLQPFEQRTYQVVFAVDTTANVVPVVEAFGAGNGGTFEIHTEMLPLQDNSQPRAFAVMTKGALPNAEYRIVTGVATWTPIPFIAGIEFWIDPTALVGVFGGFADANGRAQEVFTIPVSPYLTGFSAYHQGFSVDAAAPNGFAYYTPGMRTKVGRL